MLVSSFLHATKQFGKTALDLARMYNHHDCVKILKGTTFSPGELTPTVEMKEGRMGCLPCQFQSPFCERGGLQCSWFSMGCAARMTDLVDAWHTSENTFRALYEDILTVATTMRAETSRSERLIQTLFFPPIIDFYALEVGEWNHHLINPDAADEWDSFFSELSNAKEVKSTKLSFPHQSFEELEQQLHRLHQNRNSFVGHRSGQVGFSSQE